VDGGIDKAKSVVENFRKAASSESLDREIWKKTFEYVNNRVDGELGQWDSNTRAQLGARPGLSFPEVGKFIDRISGAQRATKIDEKVYPRDDVADPVIADILTDVLKHVYDLPENRVEWQISRAFRNGIICGRGWLKLEWTDEFDPLGEISIRNIHPRNVFICGRGDRYDLMDRIGVIEKIPMTKEELKATYPDKYEEILSQREAIEDELKVAQEDYDFTFTSEDFWDKEEKEYFILRQQRWEWVPMRFLRGPGGELEPVEENVPDEEAPGHIKKRVRRVKVTSVCGSVVLEDEISPYKHAKFDLIPFFPYFDDGITRGVAQNLLDSQDEKNKRRSQITHILGVVAKGNHFVKEGTFADPTKAKEKMGGTGEFIAVNVTGNINESIQAIRPDLTLFPALINLDQLATQEMKEISGLGDASLGQVPSGVRSGVALQQLQLPTETIIGEMVENYLETRKTLAQCTVALVQQYYTSEKRIRILGDYTKDFVPDEIREMYDALKKQIMSSQPLFDDAMAGELAGQMIDLQSGAKVVTINKQFGEQRLNDITVGRFDIAIDHVSQNPTTRRGLMWDLMNLRAQGVPIPNKTLVEYSEIRNKKKVMAEMENYEMQLLQQAVAEQLQKSAKGASPTQDNEGLNSNGSQLPMI